jgi:uncharacterized Zn finger protein
MTFHSNTMHEEDNMLFDCQGICKDCGNGTLNNRVLEAFDYNGDYVYCLNCGSTHVDIVTL